MTNSRGNVEQRTTELILVRHGQTEWNQAGRIQGHGDSPLTAQGIAQAHAMAERLKHEKIDHICASDLGRARRTAEIIAQERASEIEFAASVRERSFGVAEGQSYAQLADLHPQMFSREQDTDPHFAPPGGESRQQHFDRVCEAMDAIANIRNGQRVLVVTHGGVLSNIYRRLSGIAVAAPHPIDIPNVAYNLIERKAGIWSIRVWGDTSHLTSLTSRDY